MAQQYRRTVADVKNFNGRYFFVREGLDVPLDQKRDLLDPKRVTDDTRIFDGFPTIEYIVERDGIAVLAAGWCGRPKGVDADFSMAPVAKRIEQIFRERGKLKHPVLIAPDCYEDKTPKSTYAHQEEVRSIVRSAKPGQVVVLENVRYDPEANANDKDFSAFMASLVGENAVYVNEAETQNHRPEATIVSVPKLIVQNGGDVVYGFQYASVLSSIGTLRQKLEEAERGSFVFGLCGKKIESDPGITSKITVARDLIDIMREGDTIITGGAVSYTFLLAQHYSSKIESNLDKVNEVVRKYDEMIVAQTKGVKDKKVAAAVTEGLQKQKSSELKTLLEITDAEIKKLVGDSYIRWGQEGEQIVFAYSVMTKAKARGVEVISAYDHTITNGKPNKAGMLENAEVKIFENATGIPAGWLGVAPGPKTLDKIASVIENAAVYLQSGPYSIEDPKVEEVSGTDKVIFEAVKRCKDNDGTTIAAGGDTTARVNMRKTQDAFSTITSAGGATLELINGDSKGRDAVEEAQKLKK